MKRSIPKKRYLPKSEDTRANVFLSSTTKFEAKLQSSQQGQVLASIHRKSIRVVPWKSAAGWQDLSSPELAGGRLDTEDPSSRR